ncbi:hypothetical protein [Rhizohabitans arisaemae]|uniref:hypothetical protein n=1 Tax=Rhizohabitans arisaemae TaxID=2720610 RepID=UPI0024B15A7A|nr:hypothetical protein [Rhizohabitans arisaemae]
MAEPILERYDESGDTAEVRGHETLPIYRNLEEYKSAARSLWMRKSGQDGKGNNRRLPSYAAYLLSLFLNSTLGFLGQLALFYPYFVARDWLAGLGIAPWGIPFRDGYSGALLIGIPLVVVFAAITAALNFAVLRFSPPSRRLYWSSAVLVALVSSAVQLLWNHS